MKQKQAILIPQWIATALAKARLPLAVVSDYKEISKLFPVSELAAMLALQSWGSLQTVLEESPNSTYSFLCSLWEKTATEQQRTELESVLRPMSNSDETKKYLYEQLGDDEEAAKSSISNFVQVQDLDEQSLSIVVGQGSVQWLQSDINAVKVVREVVRLKRAYAGPCLEGTSSMWYRRYLRLIALTCANKPPTPFSI